jgi:predicted double-glycine peptidase
MRALALGCLVCVAAHTSHAQTPAEAARPVSLLDVPFVSQSELLCGGAAAAMVLRYWGERELTAEAFAPLVDRSAAGIRTDALVADLRRRGWQTREVDGDEAAVQRELASARPVLLLIEDRPSTFHYVVAVAWHERGVVFHDPARGPFRVMSTREFTRRWRAARRWMAVVTPRDGIADSGAGMRTNVEPPSPGSRIPGPGCERVVSEGVRLAQQQQLDDAERVLADALDCPGTTRELAGIRVLQKRWGEAADLASVAVAADRGDTYAWKVLATSRFVQDDRLGALQAWNAIGEPRIDLVRVDGLIRTRHPVVERLLDARPGELLTAGRFARARRQLAELPAATSTRLEYVPVSGGLAELRGAVAERPVVPRGFATFAATALIAAITRDVRLTAGSVAGGGEQLSVGYRFWPHRQRVDGGIDAPARWGGIWRLDAYAERQPFTGGGVRRAERTGARLALSDWASGHLRWTVGTGIDDWAEQAPRGVIAGRLRWASLGDRIDASGAAHVWPGGGRFATFGVGARMRSSIDAGLRRTTPVHGVVTIATAGVHFATARAPLDVWPAGDTGHARATLTRAHPLLDDGRLRIERLGRALLQASIEGRRWWNAVGPVRAAAAAFTDVHRTARRWNGAPLFDVDAGIGVRFDVAGTPGVVRVDVAKGLRDGATAISVGYEPWDVVVE